MQFIKKEKYWGIAMWILLAVLLLPLIYIGRYNVMSADDFAYGLEVHQEWQTNHSLPRTVGTAFKVVSSRYINWQGTYTSVFFMSLNPLNFNSNIGWLIPIVILGMLCVAVWFFIRQGMGILTAGQYKKGLVANTAVAIFLIGFIESITSPVEGYFWYNGATHYMLMHAFMLFFVGQFLKLDKRNCLATMPGRYIISAVFLSLFGVLVGGGNYITALQCVELTTILLFVGIYTKNISVAQIVGFIFLLGGFLINVLAPGNAVRQSGTNGMGAVQAILHSFILALKDIKVWCTPFAIVCLLILLPIFWKIIKEVRFHFPYPLVVVLFLFCLYSSLYSPCLYGVGNVDSGRMRNVIQGSFYFYAAGGCLYLLGYLYNRMNETKKEWAMDLSQVLRIGHKYLWLYRVGLSALLFVVLFFTGDKNTYSSISALRSVIIGEAQQYYAEAQERLMLIESNEADIYLEPFSVHPHVLYFSDYVAKDDVNNWVNRSAAQYYGKDSIQLRSQ